MSQWAPRYDSNLRNSGSLSPSGFPICSSKIRRAPARGCSPYDRMAAGRSSFPLLKLSGCLSPARRSSMDCRSPSSLGCPSVLLTMTNEEMCKLLGETSLLGGSVQRGNSCSDESEVKAHTGMGAALLKGLLRRQFHNSRSDQVGADTVRDSLPTRRLFAQLR